MCVCVCVCVCVRVCVCVLYSNIYSNQRVHLPVHLVGFSYHSRSVSLPSRWKHCGSHPGKIFENLTFFPVSQAVPTGVLRQGVE